MLTKTTISTIVTIALALLLSGTAYATPVDSDHVIVAIETWVRHVTADAKPDAVVTWLEPHVVDGQTVAYIAHLEGGGYCICGADDRLAPVYLYRPVGTYDPSNPAYQAILQEIAERLAHRESVARKLINTDEIEALSRRVLQWDALSAGQLPLEPVLEAAAAEPTMMTLPLTSRWHQRSPYNDQCPVLTPGSDEHCVVGCVATTASQIMYYWKWPPSGVGSQTVYYNYRYRLDWDYEPLPTDPQLSLNSFWTNRLYWTATDGGRLYMSGYWDATVYNEARKKCNNGSACDDSDYLAALEAVYNRLTPSWTAYSANFSTSTYDFDLMSDEHTDPPDAGDDEAAKLCHHAGLGVDMGYGVFGSSAYWVRDAMVAHFQYDPDASTQSRNATITVEEIQWMRPIEISGTSDTGGHSWIVCGYNKGTSPWQFLMNFGWGGGSTEWYTLDDIPYPSQAYDTVRLAPLDVVQFVGGGPFGDGSPGNPYVNLATALNSVADGTTLIFKAGSSHTSPGTISKPITFKGHNVTLTAP